MLKRLLTIFTLLTAVAVHAQSVGILVYAAGAWSPAVSSSSSNPVGNVSQQVRAYCYNTGLGKWVPADSSCFGGGGSSGFPITIGSTSIAANSTTTSISGLTLVAPALGTPTALTLTNATGLPLAGLNTQAADSLVMNATAGSATPTAVAMPTCTTGADLYNTTTHAWSCVSIGSSGFPITIGSTSIAANSTTTSISGLTLVAPALGTPTGVVLTNGSGLPLSGHTTQAADTVVMNATAGSAAPTATAMPTCTTGADLYNTTTHTWSCVSTGGGSTTLYQIDNFTSKTVPGFALGWTQATAGSGNSITTQQSNTFPGHAGVIKLDSGTTSAGWMMLTLGNDSAGAGPFNFDGSSGLQSFTAEVLVPTMGNLIARFGVTYRSLMFDTRYIDFACVSTNAVPTDWYYETFDGTTLTSTDSGVSCNNAWHQLEISANNTAATFYIDGTQVGTGTAPGTTGMIMAFAVQSTAAATNRFLDVDWAAVSTQISNLK